MNDPQSRLAAAFSGQYTIEREVGAGGMATVYLAHDEKHGRKVALKVLRPELSESAGAERFPREIRFVAQFNHPHILSLYDCGEADGSLYFVMPFVDGESLGDRLARERQLPIGDAIRIVREVADALAYAHARGVVHRDIRPGNVLLSADMPWLPTSASRKRCTQPVTKRPRRSAWPWAHRSTCPPNRRRARPTSTTARIYALGVLAYEMIAGRPPFEGVSAQAVLAAHVMTTPTDLSTATGNARAVERRGDALPREESGGSVAKR